MIFPGLNRDDDDNGSDGDDDNLAMIRLPKKKKIAGGDSGLDQRNNAQKASALSDFQQRRNISATRKARTLLDMLRDELQTGENMEDLILPQQTGNNRKSNISPYKNQGGYDDRKSQLQQGQQDIYSTLAADKVNYSEQDPSKNYFFSKSQAQGRNVGNFQQQQQALAQPQQLASGVELRKRDQLSGQEVSEAERRKRERSAKRQLLEQTAAQLNVRNTLKDTQLFIEDDTTNQVNRTTNARGMIGLTSSFSPLKSTIIQDQDKKEQTMVSQLTGQQQQQMRQSQQLQQQQQYYRGQQQDQQQQQQPQMNQQQQYWQGQEQGKSQFNTNQQQQFQQVIMNTSSNNNNINNQVTGNQLEQDNATTYKAASQSDTNTPLIKQQKFPINIAKVQQRNAQFDYQQQQQLYQYLGKPGQPLPGNPPIPGQSLLSPHYQQQNQQQSQQNNPQQQQPQLISPDESSFTFLNSFLQQPEQLVSARSNYSQLLSARQDGSRNNETPNPAESSQYERACGNLYQALKKAILVQKITYSKDNNFSQASLMDTYIKELEEMVEGSVNVNPHFLFMKLKMFRDEKNLKQIVEQMQQLEINSQ